MIGVFLVPPAMALKMRKHLDHGCADCFDEPPAVVGWDLGFPDVTNPTYVPEVYAWQWKDGGRDDYCPNCFQAPTSECSLPLTGCGTLRKRRHASHQPHWYTIFAIRCLIKCALRRKIANLKRPFKCFRT